MRKELEKIAQIESYLSYKMNAAERLQFEAQMAVDPQLQSEVDDQRDLIGALLVAAFSSEVAQSHNALASNRSKILGNRFWYSLSGIALLGILTGLLFAETSVNNNQLTPGHTSPLVSMSDTTETESLNPSNPDPRHKPTRKKARKKSIHGRLEEPVSMRPQANLQNFLPETHLQRMSADRDYTFKMAQSGSTVHIPAHALIHGDGSPVFGDIEIRYKEYRDAADIAFSKVPMTVHENGEEMAFNSAGMFEIRAYQNGEELHLRPETPMIVDYNVTEQLPDLYFWRLENDKWQKEREIAFSRPIAQIVDTVKFPGGWTRRAGQIEKGRVIMKIEPVLGSKTIRKVKVRRHNDIRWYTIPISQTSTNEYTMDGFTASRYKISAKGMRTLTIRSNQDLTQQLTTMTVKLQAKPKNGFVKKMKRAIQPKGKRILEKIDGYHVIDTIIDLSAVNTDSVRIDSSYCYIYRPSPAVENYGNMVGGLACRDFGVYNCDQTYRIAGKLHIDGQYVDEAGSPIASDGQLSVIASGVNGAIAYPPAQFTCSKHSTSLLLFTNDKQLYTLSADEFDALKLKKGGDYTFKMHNATAEIKDANDLRKFLGLPAR